MTLQQMARDAKRANGGGVDLAQFWASVVEGVRSERSFMVDMHQRLVDLPSEMEAANRTYADSLGKTVAELTSVERQRAFMNHILSQDEVDRLI